MRSLTATLVISLLIGTASAAFAQGAPDTTVKSDQTAVPPRFSEPNLRLPKDSGGKSASSLIKDAPLSTDFVLGKPTAQVVMVEYASMSCPHCAHFSATVLPQLEKEYINTGKIRYVLRQFPLNEPALKAAMLLDCVGEQSTEKYYTFAKVLFDAQNKWAYDSNFMSGLETIATVGGLSHEQFQNCVTPTDREMKILKQKKLAEEQVKVPHTPYIFIAGEAYEGDRGFEAVSKFIDKKLAEGQPQGQKESPAEAPKEGAK
jgi:protein-disulfide isomerase